MSGESILETRLAPCRLRDADADQSQFAHALALTLVRSCSCVLAGVKPAAVFSHQLCLSCGARSCRGRRMTASEREVVRAFSQGLSSLGVNLDLVGLRKGRLQLLVWREDLVAQVLNDADSRAFLVSRGFGCSDVGTLMSQLRQALCDFHLGVTSAYPHEIGLVLGYPLEDVRGFIRHDREVARGPWRVYGNVKEARRRFDRLRRSQEAYQRLYEQGMTLGALVRHGRDAKVTQGTS